MEKIGSPLLLFIFVLYASFAGQTALAAAGKTSREKEKREWLLTYGTRVWVGPALERRQEIACRMTDHGVIFFKPWGLVTGYHTAEIRPCDPSLFNRFSPGN